jgi:hypothetical protein
MRSASLIQASGRKLEGDGGIWQDGTLSPRRIREPAVVMNVISLDRARSRLRPGRRVEPPSALGGLMIPPGSRARAADDADDRLRMRQNLAALAVIAAIIVAGFWLIDSLRYYSRLQACVEAGHRNCLPLQAKYQPSPYWR